MKIVVCVKQALALADEEIEFTGDGRDVDPDFLEPTLNEWDAFATEEALKLREQAGDGEVVLVTVGEEGAEEALRRALAMGADRAVRVELGPDRVHDPLTIARALAEPVRAEDPDMVLAGVQSSDTVQSATGTALAQLLDLPRVAVISKLDHEPGSPRATAHRELEGGLLDVTEVDTPALMTVQTGINEPRYANLRAIKQAKQKELRVVSADVEDTPAYRVRRMYLPPKSEGAEMLEGSPAEIARRINEIVKERVA